MFFYKGFKLNRWTTVGQRTAGIQIGYQYFLVRTKDFGCFAHEMNATKHQDIGRCLGSPLRQSQTVAYKISNVLNLCCLIIMRQDNGVLLFSQFINFFLQINPCRNRYIHISDRLCLHISLIIGYILDYSMQK